jgi:DNA-binding response OmpR family regulator
MELVIYMNNLLLVEDDYALADSLSYYLKSEGYNIFLTSNIKDADKIIENDKIDLAILDINLPDGSGFDLCKKIRSNSDIPIIFLTARDEESDVINGFDIGADDYVTKPFKARELSSRIKSLLRRVKKANEDIIKIQDLIVDPKQYKIFKNNNEIEVTALEFKLLLFLINNKGIVLSREQILTSLWDNFDRFVNDNTLTVYIKRLREKIEDNPLDPKIIKTVRGIGYIVGD